MDDNIHTQIKFLVDTKIEILSCQDIYYFLVVVISSQSISHDIWPSPISSPQMHPFYKIKCIEIKSTVPKRCKKPKHTQKPINPFSLNISNLLGHHHLDEFFIINLSIPINICFPNHLIHFFICKLLSKVGHDVTQFSCGDESISVLVEYLEGFEDFFFTVSVLHFTCHHGEEFWEVYGSISICINLKREREEERNSDIEGKIGSCQIMRMGWKERNGRKKYRNFENIAFDKIESL